MARTASKRSSSRVKSANAKTTRPEADSRRGPENPQDVFFGAGRKLDAMPDRIDIRDWFYQPSLAPLPFQIVNCDQVPEILDQGQEGACTGYALASVVNYHLHQRRDTGDGVRRYPVSPQMLYELARRYDEWPGEAYEGSSARGAMKAWVRHGVCRLDLWPSISKGSMHLTAAVAQDALRAPGGAFYRVMHRQIRDVHAALAEAGILFVTLMVHDGWQRPGPETRTVTYEFQGETRSRDLPVIQRRGRANSGHAVVIVGYTTDGFIIQNSWGRSWGNGGFALLPYPDYALHATDVWVAQLGVPVSTDIWTSGAADTTAGSARASDFIPLPEIRPFVVNVGNNGKLSSTGDYWTTEEDIRRLFSETIPAQAKTWERRRVMLFLHGGLNNEVDTAKRVLAMRDVLLENEIYPLHIMWESGAAETIRNIISDIVNTDQRAAGGVAEWLRRTRDGLIEAKDWTFELTAARPGGALWTEMKENAQLASERKDGQGAMQILARHVKAVLQKTQPDEVRRWELHVVAHSAGSIYATHAMPHLLKSGVPLKSLHFMAPAMTVALFKEQLMPLIQSGKCPSPDTYILNDVGERDDDVGPYGKSLLYLVSNAFEQRRFTPLLGMEKFISKLSGEAGRAQVELDPDVMQLLAPTLVVSGKPKRGDLGPSRSESHGGFDNDPETLNSILRRVLGRAPSREFERRDLQF